MSQFIIKKKKDVKENSENKNIIILKDINMTILDTKYAMKEIKDNSLRKIIKVNKNSISNNDGLDLKTDIIKTVEEKLSGSEINISTEDPRSSTEDLEINKILGLGKKKVVINQNNESEKIDILDKESLNSSITVSGNPDFRSCNIGIKKTNFENGINDSRPVEKKEENKSSFVTKKIQRKKKDVEIHIPHKDENSIILNNDEINDLRSVTTKLEHLGISNEQKFNQFQSLIKNENVNVKLYSSLPILRNDIDTGRNLDLRNNDKKTIPSKTNLYCWWCKYQIPFDIHPLGCPVKYHRKDIPGQGTGLNEYFETDGIFCSFNCICAYSNEVSIYNIRYKESGGLLYILYKKIFDTFPPNMNIVPALDWRLLKNFGGTMSIDDFRNNFQKIDNVSLNYIKHTQTIKIPGSGLKDINIKQNSISYIDEKSKENLSNY